VKEVTQVPKLPSLELELAPLFRLSPPVRVGVTAGVAGVLLVVLGAELVLPPLISLSAFVFIPVLVGAWLLPPRLAWPVVAVATAVRLVGLLEGGAQALTAAAEILMVVTIGAVTLLAADRVRRWQEAQTELGKQAAHVAAAAERERIAGQLTDDVTRNLFATTLDLQGAMGFVEHEVARQRIATALNRLDEQITGLRHLVFKRGTDEAPVA
jgi:signal transduction histidine kinase